MHMRHHTSPDGSVAPRARALCTSGPPLPTPPHAPTPADGVAASSTPPMLTSHPRAFATAPSAAGLHAPTTARAPPELPSPQIGLLHDDAHDGARALCPPSPPTAFPTTAGWCQSQI